ncbi:MAG: hypothetical protein IPO21_13690, partial [Bacteroidales bacterium]|nr:hypothetical protein [Bacteroidales bacterium]
MINIQATYFDGISSVPNIINISFCDTDGTITLSKAVGGVSMLNAEEFYFERYGNCLYLKISEKDESSIKICESDFIELFIKYRKRKRKIGVYDFLVNQSFKTYIFIAVIVLG